MQPLGPSSSYSSLNTEVPSRASLIPTYKLTGIESCQELLDALVGAATLVMPIHVVQEGAVVSIAAQLAQLQCI